MTEPADNILRRIRALLDRAEHQNTGEPERDAAMAKATDMMATYGIERAMLGASGLRIDDPIDQTTIAMTDPYSYEKAVLLIHVAKALRCKPMTWTRGRKINRVALVGTASDRERVNMIYTSLLIQAERGMLRETSPYRDAADTKARRAAYLVGFANEVGKRLREAEARAARVYDEQHSAAGTPGTALVLVDHQALVKRRYAELFPDVRTWGRGRRYDTSAYDRGQRSGRTADIGTTRVNGAGTRRLGGSR